MISVHMGGSESDDEDLGLRGWSLVSLVVSRPTVALGPGQWDRVGK